MKRIPLKGKHGDGKYALVDHSDFDRVAQYTWYVNTWGYAYRNVDGKTESMHRFILQPPRHKEVDHRSGNKLDNRRHNLRPCTREQNARNVTRKLNKPYKGVHRAGYDRYWTVFRQAYFGPFDTKEEAAHTYNVCADQAYGDFARLNELPS